MTSPASDEERCPTCGQTKTWHEENKPRHAFGGPVGVISPRPVVKAAPWPFDPVLRQALMEIMLPVCDCCGTVIGDPVKHAEWHSSTMPIGVTQKPLLEPADLTKAEDRIRAVTAQFEGRNSDTGNSFGRS